MRELCKYLFFYLSHTPYSALIQKQLVVHQLHACEHERMAQLRNHLQVLICRPFTVSVRKIEHLINECTTEMNAKGKGNPEIRTQLPNPIDVDELLNEEDQISRLAITQGIESRVFRSMSLISPSQASAHGCARAQAQTPA